MRRIAVIGEEGDRLFLSGDLSVVFAPTITTRDLSFEYNRNIVVRKLGVLEVEVVKRRCLVFPTLFFLAMTLVASACGGSSASSAQEFSLAPESALPDFVRDAPPQVKEAYRFAIANPDILSAFPCYCGCGAMGHESNRDCYIKEIRADGSIEFENHALG